jgi:hypothetical protein
MVDRLDHKQEMLLAFLLAGKLPRNLAWNEVIELMRRVGEVLPRSGNEVEFVVGSHSAFFNRPHTHSLEVDEVSRLRRFLHEAGLGAAAAETTPAGRTIVVIDHHIARIYQHLGGSGLERKKNREALRSTWISSALDPPQRIRLCGATCSGERFFP